MRPSTERLTCPGRGAWGRMLWIGAALFAAGAAQASLQGRDADGNAANGFEAYYDNVLGITWLADANHAYSSGQAAGSFGAMTWTATQAWLSGSVNAGGGLYGVTTWRLPASTLANPPNFTYGSLSDYYIGAADYGINHSQHSNELGYMYSVNLGLRAHADTAGVDYLDGTYGLTSPSVQQSNMVLGGFYNTAQLVDLTHGDSGLTFRRISTDALWTGTTVTDDPEVGSGTWALYLQTNDGIMDVIESTASSAGSNTAAAWLVADGDVFSTAVPEPGSLALMLGGLGVLGWRRHRRGRSY